ncbi:MAG: methyltransferase domain-containing protein [Cyanobacteria bacterium]|nr:methyltransferase domain-containing protein [Cyanobacteriota bacterium]
MEPLPPTTTAAEAAPSGRFSSEGQTQIAPHFWNEFYASETLPWDIGQPAPPLVALYQEHKALLPPGKLAVLGSGAGHDAGFWGQQGFEVTGFDYAPEAVALAKARYGNDATFVQADIFQLPPEYLKAFDYVVEHTCFCAILPSQRPEYVKVVHQLLNDAGRLLGLFWERQPAEGGPPFRTDALELADLFSPAFAFESMGTPNNSISKRSGEEILCVMRKNSHYHP